MKNVKSGHSHPIVCLDAGHYGKYNRSPVVKDYYESEMAWALTNYEKAELEKYSIEVWLTRSDQTRDLAVISRGRAAEGADLLISNHSNGCGTESVDRPEGIYLYDDDCGAIDEQSREIAQLLAETVAQVMGTTDKAKVYSRKASGDRDGDGVKNDDYYGVLYGAHQVGTPAVIMEHSFHTNTRAAKWLSVDANLKLLAAAKAKVIAQWFDVSQCTTKAATEAARGYDADLEGTYRATCNLNVRNGAGATANNFGRDKHVLVTLPKGAKARCLGAYTTAVGVKWLYIHFARDGVTYTGFASGRYLKKV